MAGDFAEPLICYLGPGEGPNLSWIAPKSYDSQKMLSNLVKTCLNSTTTWRNLDRSWHLRKELFSEAEMSIPEYQEGMSGYFAIDPERSKDGTENDQRVIFFLFPTGTDPVDALKTIDQTEKGALPAAIAAAVLTAHQAFRNGHTSIASAPAVFASVAQSWPVQGPSSLTGEQIAQLVRQTIDHRRTSNRDLANIIPGGAFDRARFLLALAETAWCFHTRKKLIKNHYWFPQLETHLASIASAWLYLQYDPSFDTPFHPVTVNRGQAVNPAGWTQALEWDAHAIPARVFDVMRPQIGSIIGTDDLSLKAPLSSIAQILAPAFSELLLQELPAATDLPAPLRIRLPDGIITAPARNHTWTLYPAKENEMWIAFENTKRGKFSFCWSPTASPTYGWLPGRLNTVDYLYWNVLFCGLWHDLAHCGEDAFPYADSDARNLYAVRHWGTESQVRSSIAWAVQMAEKVTTHTKVQSGYPQQIKDFFKVHLQNEKKQELLGLSFFVLLECLASL